MLALPVSLVLTTIASGVLDRTPAYPVLVTAVYAVLAVTVLLTLPARASGPGIGPANRVTLGRVLLMLPIVGLALDPAPIGTAARWWIVGFGTAALLLDGLDGYVARRTGTSSGFGARFDMESDAAFMMVLCILVWRTDQVGAWVLLIGALRYLFVGAGVVWPRLRGDLPPSIRRKVICVVQGIALLVALGPIISAAWATLSSAAALALLTWSFASDTRWLMQNGARVGRDGEAV